MQSTPRSAAGTNQSRQIHPPGPRGQLLLGSMRDMRRDPLRFLLRTAHHYGDVVRFRCLHLPCYLVNHPDYIRHVLQDNQENYSKVVFDYNLLKLSLDQRRLIQPAFHHQRVGAIGPLVADATTSMLNRWDAMARRGQPLDVAQQMLELALEIVARTLFSVDLQEQVATVAAACAQIQHLTARSSDAPLLVPLVPTLYTRRLQAAVAELHALVDGMIAARRQRPDDADDLLTLLLHARDSETGQTLDDEQVRDEIMTMLLAGSETTAHTLAWTWYLLGEHPAVAERLRAEGKTVLEARVADVEDLSSLSYSRMVIDEALRLYPPAWSIGKRTLAEDEIGGYHIAANALMLVSPYTLHRNAAFWEAPDKFDPERFSPARIAARHRYAYAPFGGGPRMCVGDTFARTTAQLILAHIAQRYHLRLVAGHPVAPHPLLTLRPRYGMLMTLATP